MRYAIGVIAALVSVFFLQVSAHGVEADDNLIRNGDFSQGIEGWDKFHSSNVNDTWSIDVQGEDRHVMWTRERSRNDGGSVGVVQTMDVDATGFEKLILSIDVMVKHHTLLNAGWWAEDRGGSGEYPVKIILFYTDAKDNQHMWTHGFLSTLQRQPVVYTDPKTGMQEKHDAGMGLTNLTLVPRGEWSHYEVDLMDQQQRVDMDLSRRGQQMPRPARLTMIRVVGQGWDFAAAVDNISLHGE